MNTENKNIYAKEPGWLNEFLWMCSGADRAVLRQCPTDWAKYAGTGGTILFTALMAAISGAYALNFVFDSLYYAIPFGIFWGALIFNLDRFMVNTMYSDGKHTISKEEIKGGMPRIVLAIFLGVVISTPIEMKIFDDTISENLPTVKAKANEKFNGQKAEFEVHKTALIDRKDSVSRELSNQQAGTPETIKALEKAKNELNEINDKLYKEIYGTGVTKKAGIGPASQELQKQQAFKQREVNQLEAKAEREAVELRTIIKENRDRLQHELEQIDSELQYVQGQINEINASKSSTTEGLKHFSAQLEALYIGTSWSESPTLCIARLMVMLLFVAIEVIPTLFKMMVSFGPYDNYLNAERHKIKVLSEKKISDINDDINTSVKISTEHNRNRLAAETLANKELLEKISSAQADILSEAIALWKEEELRKIRQNPSLYIQSGNAAISNGPITAISERVSDNRQNNHHESSADFVQNVPEESIISTSNEGISISEEPVNTSDVVSSNSEIVQNTNVDQSSNEEDEESSNVNNNQTITT
jgi:hypothetical protein